ncbi:cyd operon protein YbgE [Actinobacillus seminis]|uniref:Cyd operon protein YbgE n=2 Tax=Actinobacillus seminis TaxID=722 RepID=A0ABX4FRM0_9PAST|nr:cyd operon protein YbgE [Actinobacillus seminis]OZN24828.1 cyd operon protein YbgE [Actinobacillus seminis]
MINSLYQFTNKGSWRALSCILALVLTFSLFFNVNGFAGTLRSFSPYLIILGMWAIITLWIHGMGFVIRKLLWKACFLPLLSYVILLIIALSSLI